MHTLPQESFLVVLSILLLVARSPGAEPKPQIK